MVSWREVLEWHAVIPGASEAMILSTRCWFFTSFLYTFPMLSFLLRNHEIGHYSGYQTEVIADYFYELRHVQDITRLQEIFLFAQALTIPFLIIGGGTNLLFTSTRFEGVIIKNSLVWWNYDRETKELKSYSNEPIWNIAEALEMDHMQPIWHRFIGLPGSVGGAVFGNAGCFGLETASNFQSARIYDMITWTEHIFSKDEMQFWYRYSFLKEQSHMFLLEASFDLSEIREKYASTVDNLYFREHGQPQGYSCGSFFKNPSRELSAGMLIESIGMKWYRYGWAYWSPLHANFLMSDGVACLPTDLIELVRLTQERVKDAKWVDLSNEVRII